MHNNSTTTTNTNTTTTTITSTTTTTAANAHNNTHNNASANSSTGGGGQGGYASNFSGGAASTAEVQVIGAILRPLVTRFVESLRELRAAEHMALFCDVRQLMGYMKSAHGGPFRLVALSGIMAVTPRPNKQPPKVQTTRVIR